MQNQPPCHRLGWSFLFIAIHLATFSNAAQARESLDTEGDANVALAESKADQAYRAYQSKRFAEAVALYMEAYNAAPNADILYNVARIYDAKLLDRPLAINFYRRYITDPGAVGDRVQLANERLLVLREAELAATRPPPAAAPEVPSIENERRATVAIESEPAWPGAKVAGLVLASAGVIGLGVGTGFGIAAMRETKTVNELCEDNVCSEQRGIDTAESARDHATLSTIGFASGGALIAVGAVFFFWLGADPAEAPASEPSPLAARVVTTPGGFAMELGGSW